jgi:hypothetical protein
VYLRYGADLDSLNAAFRAVMQSGDPDQYDPLIRALVTRRFFEGEAGAARLDAMFERFGGRRVIHGHTPIARLTDQPPTSVTGPLISTDGRVVNVDHGLYLGGSGFVFDATESVSISQEIAT